MIIKSAEFIKSSTTAEQCPNTDMPEYAFIGRSNVGKSSLINMITGRKKLALTSSTPGKTRTINHFLINDAWYLVDLPGYGYAKRSKTERNAWKDMMDSYFTERENLLAVFVLLDSRHDPKKNDLEFMEYLGQLEVPFVMAFTKIDKIGQLKLKQLEPKYKKAMEENWEFLPQIFYTSAEKKIENKEITAFIAETNKVYNAQR
jgi:GTP-binding protein